MIDATAGTITTMNIVWQMTPQDCMMYKQCVIDVLCKVSMCVNQNEALMVLWIW